MSYCETCSTEYETTKKFCKICGSNLVAIKQDNENLSSSILDDKISDYDQTNDCENEFNSSVIETEKVINNISDDSKDALNGQSTPPIVSINEISSPLNYSVVTDIDCVTTSPVESEQIKDRQDDGDFFHHDNNHKEDLPSSDIHDNRELESLQKSSSPDQANTLKSNSESSFATNTNSRNSVFKSIGTVINGNFNRASVIKPIVIVMLSILLIGVGYWVYIKYSSVNIPQLKTNGLTSNKQQVVTVQSKTPNQVFEVIKKANLTKDIGLFMSCYSTKFKLLDNKKRDTLTGWHKYDYNSLNYDIKGLTIHKDKASGIVEWVFSAHSKDTKKTISISTLYNVVLEKENDGIWKIVFLEKL